VPHTSSWIGLACGLSVHTLTDGLALAAHVEADLAQSGSAWLPGLGTFLGILLHKPLDSLSITSLMSAAGTSAGARRLLNLGYALLCPAGAILFQLGVRSLSTQQQLVVGTALAFSAGVFVCIALSDLLPELQFHAHDRVWLSTALAAGLVLAWLIGFVEPEHSHGAGSHPPLPGAHAPHGHPHAH
jgi:zinc and cadmium transporter